MSDEKPAVQTKVEAIPPVVLAPENKVEPKRVGDTSAVLVMIYLLFKANMLTRHVVGDMLNIISKPFPENLAEWLLKESKR